MHIHEKCFSILVADDSEDDRLYLRTGLHVTSKLKIVAEVEDGEETMAYLSGAGKYSDRQKYPFPDLLVLDLKMPRFNGFEVLSWLRKHHFPTLKVVVHSGSLLKEDVAQTTDLGAHGYHVKPSSREEQRHILGNMEALLQGATT
ncbi:MAG: response regulator receiver protein [Pedosphaera sp.]|nr:response regulator receiver protein [Pedosphaera sp.]